MTVSAPDRAGGSDAAPPGEHGEWAVRGARIPLDRPVVMGVVNVTPDSFSDGGRFLDPEDAGRRARALVEQGADLLDLGAESTRPGAEPVPGEEEWRRLEPALERAVALPVPVSVDTRKYEVARRAVGAGAAVVNDVSGLADDPRLAGLAAETGAGLVLMHMRGTPRTMQADTEYDDLVGEIVGRLRSAVGRAREGGCAPDQLVVDPGIGFGKSARDCLRLLARAGDFRGAGAPVMVGPSRKSFIGETLGLPVEDRVEATAAACVMALERGARLFRVHDVRATRRALDMAEAIREVEPAGAGARAPDEGQG